MELNPQHLLEMFIGGLFTAGVVWGTVRAELRSLREADKRTDREVARAHSRIDSIYTRGISK